MPTPQKLDGSPADDPRGSRGGAARASTEYPAGGRGVATDGSTTLLQVHVVRRDPLLDFVDAAEGPEHRAPPEVIVNAAGAVVSVKFRDARPVSLDPAKAARAGRGGHPHLLQ